MDILKDVFGGVSWGLPPAGFVILLFLMAYLIMKRPRSSLPALALCFLAGLLGTLWWVW